MATTYREARSGNINPPDFCLTNDTRGNFFFFLNETINFELVINDFHFSTVDISLLSHAQVMVPSVCRLERETLLFSIIQVIKNKCWLRFNRDRLQWVDSLFYELLIDWPYGSLMVHRSVCYLPIIRQELAVNSTLSIRLEISDRKQCINPKKTQYICFKVACLLHDLLTMLYLWYSHIAYLLQSVNLNTISDA